MPRTFIAFPLDPENRLRLHRLQTELDWSGADIKWVSANHIHLTLRFLGTVPEPLVQNIKCCLTATFEDVPVIPVTIGHLGAFPASSRPKVIWAGLQDQNARLEESRRLLESALGRLGIAAEERAFSAHITLGRVRRLNKNHGLKRTLSTFRFEPPMRQSLTRIVLYQSTLTPAGPIYTALREVPLKNTFTPQE